MTAIVTKWEFEAKQRAPVESGLLRNTITHEVGLEGGELWGAVGSNQKYAKYLEFGTDSIAGGKVKALGVRDDVTDAQAIHTWAAKEANETSQTSVSRDKNGVLLNRAGTAAKLSRGKGGVTQRAQEQLPWLRPAFMAIRDWAIERLASAFSFE